MEYFSAFFCVGILYGEVFEGADSVDMVVGHFCDKKWAVNFRNFFSNFASVVGKGGPMGPLARNLLFFSTGDFFFIF